MPSKTKRVAVPKGSSIYAGTIYPTTNRDEVFRLRFAAGLVAVEPFRPTATRVRTLRKRGFRYEEIAAAISAAVGEKVSSATVKTLEKAKGDPIYLGRGTRAIGTGALLARRAS